MNIYWSLHRVPELAPLKSADRRLVHEACLRRYFWGAAVTRKGFMMYVSLMLFPVVTLLLMTAAERAFGGTSPVWLIVATLTVSAAVGRFVLSRVAVAQLRQFYPDYIRRELS